MADPAVKLPPGYTLDEPPVNLPPGYTVDAQIVADPTALEKLPEARTPGEVQNSLNQANAGMYRAYGWTQGLGANIFDLLDKASRIPWAPNLTEHGLLGQVRDWLHQHEQAQYQEAAKYAGGRQDLTSQLIRGATEGILKIPAYAATAYALGPAAGMAALGGLERENQGIAPTIAGGLEGALMGKAMEWAGPASRWIRGPVFGGLGYLQSRMGGSDNTAALANAITMGGMSALPAGGMTAADIARMNFNQAKLAGQQFLSLPFFKTTLNPVEQQAISTMQAEGVPMRASTITGNKALLAAEGVTEASPLGAVQAAEYNRATNAGVEAMAQRIMEQQFPEPQSPWSAGTATRAGLNEQIAGFKQQKDAAYEQAWAGRGNPEFTEEVPVRTHPDGSLEIEPVNMPVDIRDLKRMAQPIYDELDTRLSQMQKDQNAAFGAMAKLLQLPDHIPAWQAEPILSAFKDMARTNNKTGVRDVAQGVAANLIPELQNSVNSAVNRTGPDALASLQTGRAAHARMMDVVDMAEALPGEPVNAFRELVQPHDANIEFTKQVAARAPAAMPKVGRAFVQSLFEKATREGDIERAKETLNKWRDLGPQTKELLVPDAALRGKIDALFKGMQMVVRKLNTSGTEITRQATSYNPLRWAAGYFGSKVLFTPQGVQSLINAFGRQTGPNVMAAPSNVPSEAQAQFEQQRGGGQGPPEGPPPPSATINPEAGEAAYQEQQGRVGETGETSPPKGAGQRGMGRLRKHPQSLVDPRRRQPREYQPDARQ